MFLILQAMKLGAMFRHAWLVQFLYGHDPQLVQAALQQHMRFVDLVYGF